MAHLNTSTTKATDTRDIEFSWRTRRAWLQTLKTSPNEPQKPSAHFDAVIVGGGIVGTGLARELQLRGLKTLLVEKADFASGTSSKSSKLIHGGLRYLEMLDFGLVFESLSERHWLLKTHPHLVQPLEFNLPIYAKTLAPKGARSSALLGLGLWLYDALSLFRTPFFHGKYASDVVQKKFPGILTSGLKGSYFYADAMMLDDELVLECAYDAVRRGAWCLNYVEATHVQKKASGHGFQLRLQDTLPGAASEPFEVTCDEVISCVGPWTEQFGDNVALGAERKLKPSKGVHLIFPYHRLPVDSCLVMYAADGRIVFAIPRKDFGSGAEVVIVGTTDSKSHAPIEQTTTDADDRQYLLNVLNAYFPKARFVENDIIAEYAGIRPLLDEGKESEAKTSREHEIWRNKAGIVFMAGGKYTTFRKISEEIADFTFPNSKCRSDNRAPLSRPELYEKLFQSGDPVWGKYTTAYFDYKLRHHCPVVWDDVWFRRSPVWMLGRETPSLAPQARNLLEKMWSAFHHTNADAV